MKYFVSLFLDDSIKTLDVKTAMQKGRLLLFWIPFIGMLSCFGIAIYYFDQDNITYGLPIFLLGFMLPWIYWGRASVLWKLWAFERVRNVHELEKKGIESLIIYHVDSFWNKTEIKTKVEKIKLEKLYEKFDVDDELIENHQIASETYIENSGRDARLMSFIFGGVSVLFSYFIIQDNFDELVQERKTIFFLPVAIALSIFYFFRSRKLQKNKKFFRFNAQGITSELHPLIPWNDIDGIDITKKHLHYWYYDQNTEEQDYIDVDLEKYGCNISELEDAIKTYRYRYDHMNIKRKE